MFRSDLGAEYRRGANPLTRRREELVSSGETITDLVSGDLQSAGLGFPGDRLAAIIEEARPRAARYQPDPLGRMEAREAVVAYYAARGVTVDAQHVVITPGTSLSYLYAFSILTGAGDEVLCPRPSYPLFDEIARITGTRLVPYRLRERDGWRIDLDHLEGQISTRTRAIVLISPHNPTGAVATADEIRGLGEIASRHGIAIIADEVFDEFVYAQGTLARAARSGAPLVLTLNGFSKMFALPGWKLGWIALTGEASRVETAAWLLAHVADAFLPVNELAQCTAAGIFREGGTTTDAIRAHLAANRETALAILGTEPRLGVIPPAGGFFLTARIDADGVEEEPLALSLLSRARILVHPGYYYDLPPDHLILSLTAARSVLPAALDSLRAILASPSAGG